MSRATHPEGASINLHATCVAVEDRGLLLLGASGSGKSGLALRMMALGAVLVADDRVRIDRRADALVASAPPSLRGLIEARGVGLLRAATRDETVLTLAVDLDRRDAARMPHLREITILGVEIELILGHASPNLEATLLQMLRCGRAD